MTKVKTVLLRRWPILVIVAVLGLIAGGVSAALGTSREIANYQAERVLIANSGIAGSSPNVKQDALKATRGDVLAEAARLLGQPNRALALSRAINTRSSTDSNSITLTTYDTDPDEAAERVDAFAEAFLTVVNSDLQKDQIERQEVLQERFDYAAAALDGFDDEHPDLMDPNLPATPANQAALADRDSLVQAKLRAEDNLNQYTLEVTRRTPYSSLGVAEPRLAEAQLVEVPDSPLFRSALVGLIGLLLGAGLILLIERANARIDTREELAELVPFPIIAEVNRLTPRRQPRHHDSRLRLDGPWGEQYRRVKSAIQFAQAHPGEPTADHQEPRVFLFVSALPSEGKSTSVALTATALAQSGQATLAINADFRVPRLDRMLGVDSSPSIADRAELSTSRASIDDVLQKTLEPNLTVASSGSPTREVTRRIQAASEIALEMADRGETVLIDSTPLQVANDTIDLLPAADSVVVVVRAGRTTRRALTEAVAALEQHEADILGAILVGTIEARESKAYYGSYYDTVGGRSPREELVDVLAPEVSADQT